MPDRISDAGFHRDMCLTPMQASLQQDAHDALDMAEKATAGLQQEAALLGRERDELKAALASQVAAATEGARRFEALEQELEEATKNAAQAGHPLHACLHLVEKHIELHTQHIFQHISRW